MSSRRDRRPNDWSTPRSSGSTACRCASPTSEPEAAQWLWRHGVADRVHVVHGDILDPLSTPVDLVVANLPYLPESQHDPRYDGEPEDAVYAPGDGLGPYRRLLDACRDGKLETGGTVLIQFHGEPLAADCWQLEDLRSELDHGADSATPHRGRAGSARAAD